MQVVKAKPRQLLPLGTPDPGGLSDNEHTSQALNTFIMEEKKPDKNVSYPSVFENLLKF